MTIYKIEEGDTVFSVAAKFGVSPELLIVNNSLQGIENTLPTGLSLVIAVPQTVHTVYRGETVSSIAAKYGVSPNDIYRHNIILNGLDTIYPGQTIVIEYNDKPIYDYSVGGYSYISVKEQILDTALPFMKLFMPFTYGFTPDGELVELADTRLLDRAFKYSSQPYFHLSTLTDNGNFSNELSRELLAEPQKWEVLADNVIKKMLEKGYTGLDIDFEFLGASARYVYPEFISYMRKRVSVYSLPLIVALPPKTSSDQQGQLYEGVDYDLLGKAADYVLLMTYEWGYTYGPPMPVSPTPSIRRVLDYAVSEIDSKKIFMGISNYGYDWTLPYVSGTSRATSLSNIDAAILASRTGSQILYSGEYEAPYYFYTDNSGNIHEVWFEDARSIKAKLDLINEYSLFGGLYWNLTRPNPQNLTLLSLLIKYLT